MVDRPLICTGESVLAILDGRKTMTRRIHTQGKRGWTVPRDGDRYWVKETWGCPNADHPLCPDGRRPKDGDRIVYRANAADAWQWQPGHPGCGSFVWRSPLYMPRWASRLTLEVTGFRIERLHDMPEADVYAEGLTEADVRHWRQWVGPDAPWMAFGQRWDSINEKKAPWASNPWVKVISFRRLA